MVNEAPSLADIVRASSTIEAYGRLYPAVSRPEILEAAETMSAAYHHAVQSDQADDPGKARIFGESIRHNEGAHTEDDPCPCGWIDPDPCPPHGIPRPDACDLVRVVREDREGLEADRLRSPRGVLAVMFVGAAVLAVMFVGAAVLVPLGWWWL